MKKVYINPGHSDIDPGAVKYETERDLNVRTALFMNSYLVEHYFVETKITDGKLDRMKDICADANNWGADLFVSIHNNAGGGDGFECYVYNEKRRPLGQLFEKHVKAVGQNSRGVKLQPGFVVLRDTNMPAVLNEGAFVDNKKDISGWNDDAELKILGEAYAKAAAEFLQLEEKPAKPDKIYRVQVGAFREMKNAVALQKLLKSDGYDAVIV